MNAGEQILTGKKKLSLTSRSLCLLNHGFSQISDSGDFCTSFDVLPTNRTQIPMYTDLQFLYDFVQKAVAIKVTKNVHSCKIYLFLLCETLEKSFMFF